MLGRIKTCNSPMETTMQRAFCIMFGVLLISGSAVQMAAASEHHHNRSKAYFGRDISEFRGSYNQVGPIDVAPRALDRFDPSVPRNEDPVLNPPGS
jgi:hypothetical protein